jgi:hypothetical protein
MTTFAFISMMIIILWGAGHVDIVTDNAGYELFTDMCLGDLLLTTGKATTVLSSML